MKEILNRTSVRSYTDQTITKEEVEKLLKAAFSAPSARDSRPWQFIVVQDKNTLEQMSYVSDYAYMLKDASLGMVVCLDTTVKGYELEYGIMDCAAATENMLIEAKSMGIGSCWIGCYPQEERVEKLKELFKLPEHIMPCWMISFGYPKEERAVKDKWDESKIHYEKY